jgi:hypothetical protein
MVTWVLPVVDDELIVLTLAMVANCFSRGVATERP